MGKAQHKKITSIKEIGLAMALKLYRHLDHDLMLAPSQVAELHLTGTFPEEYAEVEERERRPLRYWVACHVRGHERAFSEVSHELLAKYGWNRKELEDCFEEYPKTPVQRDERPANILDMYNEQVDWQELRSKYSISKDVSREYTSDIDKTAISDLCSFPLLTPEEEQEVARCVRQGDIEARTIMIKANLKLVVSLARPYAQALHWIGLMDFISMGYIGLITAVERFNPSFGTKFSTYATWWIKQTMRRGISSYTTIGKPVWFTEEKKAVKKRKDDFFKQHGTYPDFDEVMERNLWPSTRKAMKNDLNNERLQFEDAAYVEDESVPDSLVSAKEEDSAMKDNVRGAYETALTNREQFILYHRFFSDEKETLDQVGKRLGLTRERIRQIEVKALKKLEKKLYSIYG
jgi:RNA polymerase primary sigma factor